MMKRLFLLSFVLCLASVDTMLADTVQITFTGQCSDCVGEATGVLTVTNFTPGSGFTLNLNDFVSFSYGGTNLAPAFIIDSTNVRSASGSLGPTFPDPYSVSLVGDDLRVGFEGSSLIFSSSSDGSWQVSVAAQPHDDFGSSSTYSLGGAVTIPTPEPSFTPLAAFLASCFYPLKRRFSARADRAAASQIA